MAMTIPMSTVTTIATCIQIQLRGILGGCYPPRRRGRGRRRRAADRRGPACRPTIVSGMSKPRRALALLVVALSATAFSPLAQASAAPLVGVNIPGLGDSSTPTEAIAAIAQARQMHASVVRMNFPWSFFEPQGPAISQQALSYTDRVVSYAAAQGVKIVASVDSTPCWASSAPAALVRKCSPSAGGRAESWPPTSPSAYAALLGTLAARYGDELAAIEVWNEPDQANEDYFAGPSKAARYAAILRATYPVVKRADPSMPVLAGSIVGSNGVFLRALYANGIKGYYDGLSVHYYGLTLGAVRAIHEVQLANGDDTPIWLAEFGWSSCWPARKIEEEQACVTTQAQAADLRNTIRELARAPYVAAAIVYKLRDSRSERFGALTTAGRHKPSYGALSQAFADPLGPFSRVSLTLRRSGAHVVASGGGPAGDYLGLEAFVRGRLRYRALFVLNRFNRYSIALPAVLGTSGLQVQVFQYWARPSTAAVADI